MLSLRLDESVSIHGRTTFRFTPAINQQFVSAMLDLQDDTVIAGGCSQGTKIFQLLDDGWKCSRHCLLGYRSCRVGERPARTGIRRKSSRSPSMTLVTCSLMAKGS